MDGMTRPDWPMDIRGWPAPVVDPPQAGVEVSSMSTCIYCRQSKGPFTREHVVHDGFGKFQGALVIHNAVCHDCNQEFSGTIDLALTRSSVEGYERYRFGVKKPSEIDKFKHSSLTLRVKDPGDFDGAQFVQRADPAGENLVSHIVPGISVRRKEGEGFVHFTEAQVRDGAWLQNNEVDWRLGIKVFGGDAKSDETRAILESQGVVVKWRALKPPESGEVKVQQEFEVTPEIRRALAKIAFNYLTYREGPDYALLKAFDPIRKYIRYGEKPSLSLPPVLSLEGLPFDRINTPKGEVLMDGPKRPVIHFVSLAVKTAERNVLGAVSLFSFMAHRVMLAEAFTGPLPGPSAHLYNVRMKEVFELRAGPS